MSIKSFKSLFRHFAQVTTRPKNIDITLSPTIAEASLDEVNFDSADVNPIYGNFCKEGVAHFSKPGVNEETKNFYDKAIEDYLILRKAAV